MLFGVEPPPPEQVLAALLLGALAVGWRFVLGIGGQRP